MDKISLSQDENLSFKLSHQLRVQEYQRIDIYFSIPEEMGIDATTLSEEKLFHSSIKSYSAYYSQKVHLPLVRSRFISQHKGEQSDFRSNLNLFCHQFRIALDADIKQVLKLQRSEDFYPEVVKLTEQTKVLLKKLRRYTPSDKKLSSYFENVDNYLSWYTEQSFLKLLSKGPKSSEFSEQRDCLYELCKEEDSYRSDQEYNSHVTLDDPNRITNKMRLLQRLSEIGVVFKKQTNNLNSNLKRFVRGSITAIVMAFVMTIVLNARLAFTEVSIVLIALLGLIYGVREIFKDDLTRFIWRKIQHGRPKWQHIFKNSLTKNKISHQTIWLEYINMNELPKDVDEHLKKRRQQNKQAAKFLHFRCDAKVVAKKFMPGFDEIQNRIIFNLTPFVRYLKKGEGRLYSLEGTKIANQAVERRYQMNLVLVQSNKRNEKFMQRIKITMNRSKIINIEQLQSKQNFDSPSTA